MRAVARVGSCSRFVGVIALLLFVVRVNAHVCAEFADGETFWEFGQYIKDGSGCCRVRTVVLVCWRLGVYCRRVYRVFGVWKCGGGF